MPITPIPPITVEDERIGLDFETFYSGREVNIPPTLNDIASAFGLASEVGPGKFAFLDAGGLGTDLYLCHCDGVNWWYTAMTKAVD